ncbi:MAG: sigma-70 domain-containing protein, partial [Actinomycetota bacterium]
YFRDKGWAVKVPRGLLELNMRLEHVMGDLASSQHRAPNIQELADAVEVSTEEVMEAIEAGRSRNSLSLDHSLGRGDDDDERSPMDSIGGFDDGFETTDKRLILEPGMAC